MNAQHIKKGIAESLYHPLTLAQHNIWKKQALFPLSKMFQIGGVVHGYKDLEGLQKAIQHLIEFHDAFKTRIYVKDNIPKQYFSPDVKQVEIKDFSNFDHPIEEVKKWCTKELFEPFNMLEELYRIFILKIDEKNYGFALVAHHIIVDGWSMQIISNTILKKYNEIISGHSYEACAKHSILSYIERENKYLSSPRKARDEEYWNSILYTDEAFHGVINVNNNAIRKTIFLGKEITEKISKYCKSNGIWYSIFFQGVYILFELLFNNKNDFHVYTPILGRHTKQDREIVGMFVQSIPVFGSINKENSLTEVLLDIQKLVGKSYAHSKFPLYLLQEQNKNLGYKNLRNDSVHVNYYGTQFDTEAVDGRIKVDELFNEEQSYPMQMIVRNWDIGKGFSIDIDYLTSIYRCQQVDAMMGYIQNIIFQIISEPHKLFSNLYLEEPLKIDNWLNKFNNTKVEYESNKTVLDLYADAARKWPENECIIHENQKITYKELDQKSNSLRDYILTLGIPHKSCVGIIFTHSIDVIVCILAILKAGYTFLPLDANMPINRNKEIIESSNLELLLTNIDSLESRNFSCKFVSLNKINDILIRDEFSDTENLIYRDIKTDDTAYIIYTSGSTGAPKGVMVDHSALYNYLVWAKDAYSVDDKDTYAFYSSIAFDLTITSIFLPIITGGKAIIINLENHDNIIKEIISRNVCTIIKLTPSHLALLDCLEDYTGNILRKMIVGGEQLAPKLAGDVSDAFKQKVEIYNEYGPTEATVGCIIHKYCRDVDFEYVPIGKPIYNMKSYILNKQLEAVPDYVVGELYLAGKSLAKGYYNNPALTNEVFIEHEKFGRLYKTGDKARFVDKQVIEFLGRIDEQVKINGNRVECGEIEYRIKKHRHIKEALVMACQVEGTMLLVSYYTSNVLFEENELRQYLANYLPLYMIPSIFIRLDEFPLNKNGKVDKQKLMPVENWLRPSEKTEKHTDEYTILLKNIKKLFGNKSEDYNNFFYMGGDSIKAIELSSILKQDGYQLNVADILLHPKFDEMVKFMSRNVTDYEDYEDYSDYVELAPIHNWFMRNDLIDKNDYVISLQLDLNINIGDKVNFKELFSFLLKHHSALNLVMADNGMMKYLQHTYEMEQVKLDEHDCISLEVLIKEKQKELANKIDIYNCLASGCLIKSERKLTWLLSFHHIIFDMVSGVILLNDIDALLKQQIEQNQLQLPYRSAYEVWVKQTLNRTISKEESEYWDKTKNIEGFRYVKENSLLDNCYCKIVKTNDLISKLKTHENEAIPYKLEWTNRYLEKANQSYNTTTFELLLVALESVCCELTQQSSFAIELESHGRHSNDKRYSFYDTIGWFTAIYPYIVKNDNVSLNERIIRTKNEYRKIPNNGTGYLLYNNDAYHNINSKLRFNYIGDIVKEYEFFELEQIVPSSDPSCDLEIVCYCINETLYVRCLKSNNDKNQTEKILSLFTNKIEMVFEHCFNQKFTYLRAEEFELVNISEEELSYLFSEGE